MQVEEDFVSSLLYRIFRSFSVLCSLGSVSYSGHSFTLAGNGNHSSSQGNGANTGSGNGGRAVHERSHSDTPTPLPSVDLSVESSSVTSLSNLPLRKTITSG